MSATPNQALEEWRRQIGGEQLPVWKSVMETSDHISQSVRSMQAGRAASPEHYVQRDQAADEIQLHIKAGTALLVHESSCQELSRDTCQRSSILSHLLDLGDTDPGCPAKLPLQLKSVEAWERCIRARRSTSSRNRRSAASVEGVPDSTMLAGFVVRFMAVSCSLEVLQGAKSCILRAPICQCCCFDTSAFSMNCKCIHRVRHPQVFSCESTCR